MDLQLAYLAAPQSGAVASSTQQAPAAAQAASQAAFAAQVERREETIEESAKTPDRGNRINADADGGGRGAYHPRKRQGKIYSADAEEQSEESEASSGQHFIDTTA